MSLPVAFGVWLRHSAWLPAGHGEGSGDREDIPGKNGNREGTGIGKGRLHSHPCSPTPGSEGAVGRC